ncbi:flagellar protein FliS [Desulfosporosinus acididurans]|uniref:Flagellar secretion chaperone FliS n=1 Tax=Desulfosporosinus acididurans TaxID=476652 RepID=A0A0J1FNK0_9FIRM|nr:flagellar export chaperone FliS [Desulfosporosinus acididurans]KLU65069.1 flagellar protein FliS [Desulfosporosinus acididurans]
MSDISTTDIANRTYDLSAIETATPEMLIVMLYDGALRFLQQMRSALEQQDQGSVDKWLGKLQDIFVELNTSLDMNQGEIAQNLRKLYEFYQHELILAAVEKNIDRLQPVEGFLTLFRKTWAEAAEISGTAKA